MHDKCGGFLFSFPGHFVLRAATLVLLGIAEMQLKVRSWFMAAIFGTV